ncbi:MAG: TlpA family protein disulfide reductase [Phycisphaerae bacterium]
MRECSTYRPYASRTAVVLGFLCALAGACSPGIRWRGYTFERVYADSERDQKLTFVYFRHWAVTECTDFEENVLKHPAVLEALHPNGAYYCAVLDILLDRPLADEWGVEAPPGVVILDPEGRVLARLSGEISIAQLLEAIQVAKDEFAPATQPTSVP